MLELQNELYVMEGSSKGCKFFVECSFSMMIEELSSREKNVKVKAPL